MPRFRTRHVVRHLCIATVLGLSAGSATAVPADGSVAWSREMPGAASLFPPALGPDGTVYSSNGGAVTAFTPDGAVLWSVPTDGAAGPVAIGADGTIHVNVGAVGANPTILALHPDGTERWTFDAGANIHAGPNVGPDGRIYAVADTWFGGMGFFALSPDGALQWSEEGDPPLSADTGQPHEIIFGTAHAYVTMAPQGSGGGGGQPAALWAFDLTAEAQAFTLLGSCQGQPVISPLTGALVTGNGICQRVTSHDPATGAVQWFADAPSESPCSGMANIAVGPDGAIYTAFCYRAFWSLTAGGAERWFDDDFGQYFQMNRLAVTPDNALVLDLGGDPGQPGRVRAFSSGNGALLWEVALDLTSQRANARPVFDEATGRAYVNVNRFGADTSDLFAIDLGVGTRPSCPADLDDSGAVDFTDLLTVLSAWGTTAGDVNDDGTTDFADLLQVLASWGACG